MKNQSKSFNKLAAFLTAQRFDIAWLFMLPILLWLPVLGASFSFSNRDSLIMSYPLRRYAADWVRQGIIPFWSPHLFAGSAFFANFQSSLFYPGQLFTYLLPFRLGFNLQYIFHFGVAAAGMYWLATLLDWKRPTRWFLALAFCLCSTLISSIDYLMFFSALACTPWVLGALVNLYRRPNARSAALLALSGAVFFLAGSPDMVILAALLGLVFLGSEEKSKAPWPKILLWFFVTASFWLGLVAFQLIPFLLEFAHSDRSTGLSASRIAFWSLHPLEFFALLNPLFFGGLQDKWFGQGWLRGLYLGMLPLAFLGAAAMREKRQRWWSAGAACFALLSVADFIAPVRAFLAIIPVLSKMRYPSKYFVACHFLLLLLAASGFEQWQRQKISEQKKALNIFIALALAALAIAAVQNAAMQVVWNSYPALTFENLQQYWLAKHSTVVAVQISVAMLAALLWLLHRNKLTRRFLTAAIPAAVALELLCYLPFMFELSPYEYFEQPRAVTAKILEHNPSPRYFYAIPSGEFDMNLILHHSAREIQTLHSAMMIPMLPIVSGVLFANGYQGLHPAAVDAAEAQFFKILPTRLPVEILEEWGVTHFMALQPLNDARLHEVSHSPVYIYELDPPPQPCLYAQSPCKLTRPTANDLHIEIDSPSTVPASLVLRERFHPHWRTSVGSLKPTEPYHLGMEITLPAGIRTVDLHYQEWGWPWSGWLSLGFLGVALMMLRKDPP